MSILRLIVFGLLFYFVLKIVKYFIAILFRPKKDPNEIKVNTRGGNISKNINSDDIVDAEFEEIKNNDS